MTKITRNFAYWRAMCFMALLGVLLAGATSAHAAARKAPGVESSGILFIANNVPDYQQLEASASSLLEVVVLDARGDGLRQMADALQGRQQVGAVHLISHGARGALDLGSLTLDGMTLMERSADLARIRASLRPDADLLLYGCEVAQGSEGQRFITLLGETTGAHVAASTNLTGARELGGDWVLESRTGALRSAPLAFPAYHQVLATVAGTVAIPFAHPDDSFPTQKMLDGQANTGTTNIPGIVYEFYFANTGNTPVGRVINIDLAGGTGSMLTYFNTGTSQFDPVGALIIKSQATRMFGFSSFRIQDAQALAATYTATAYRNNVTVGVPFTFSTGGSFNQVLVTLPVQFKNVDEIRITSNGGIAAGTVGAKLWQEGFNSFVFIDPTSNADLSVLSATAGALVPAFAAGTTSYTIAVSNATTSTTITPTVDIPGTTVTVNGVPVTSGAASGSIGLNVGSNTITTIATATDGTTTKTYTITITRAAPLSSNANLSSLALSTGTLSPAFASGTTSYTAGVPFGTVSLTVTPTVADGTATVTVNGVSTTSGNASGSIALAVGNNTISTVVTAEDGSTTRAYTITVTRAAASGNAQLSALSLSSGTLAPVFAAGTTSYTASVSNATTSITATPTVADANASVTVNGVAVTSGNASGAIALAVGSNTITATVTAQNGTPLSYTITVTRAASANANLSALSLSSGTLAPVFAAATTSYTVSVSNATTSITVTPTVADGGASVTVNGVATTSGNASGAIALAVGSNTITTVVTAADGATTKAYTVTMTRAASSNNNLSALSLSSGSLSPPFNPATTSYTAAIGAGVGSITVTPAAADGNASITVNGVAVTSGAASGAVAMNTGSNTVSVVVTAQNSATKTYTVTVTRAAPSSNADLSALSLSSGNLSPAFAAGTTSYTASVGNATTSLTVTPTVADATASIMVNGVATTSGNASSAIALNVGSNTITTVVTAQDGTTVKTYTVTVTRAGSGDANLSALVVSGGSIAPAFAPGTTGYTMSIAAATASVTVTPTVNDPSATVTVNGVSVASGTASGAIAMNVGANTITVVVTAQNSTTRTYTVTVTRLRPTTAAGTVPGGGGAVNASLAGPAGCGFDRADFIPLTGAAASPPAGSISGYTFSQGLFDVVVGGCPNGAAVTVTLTYPQPFPPGAVYMKYGPTPSQNAPHWYAFPGATITGNTVTLVLTDGGSGDDDLSLNGTISDPGGVALALAVGGGAGAIGIPTLSQWGVLLLSLLVAAAAGLNAWRTRRAGHGRGWVRR